MSESSPDALSSGQTSAAAVLRQADERRLLFVSKMVDGIHDVDLHSMACAYAKGSGREEANDADYIEAVRYAIDVALWSEREASSPPIEQDDHTHRAGQGEPKA